MSAADTLSNSSEPYKAAQSFGPADSDLFHGRDAEGAALAQFLTDRPIAVLTAPSGIGKTSLLHAKVLPLLEKQHWLTVYARPCQDPLRSLQDALSTQLLPDPELEASVVERIAAAMPPTEARDLRSALLWHARLPIWQRVSLHLYARAPGNAFAPLPMIGRALRGSITLDDLIEHFEALVADGAPLGIAPRMALLDLVELLRDEETRELWEAWRLRLAVGAGLKHSLDVLTNEWAPLRPGITGVMLVIDQFEEVFTRLAPEFLHKTLLEVERQSLHRRATGTHLPVHFAFCLRKEFLADLVPYLRPFGPVERLVFFLGPMPLEQARSALTGPAKLFGLTFAGQDENQVSCVDRILSFTLDDNAADSYEEPSSADQGASTQGQRYLPALISLIGAHLWSRLQAEPNVPMPLSWQDFNRLVPRLDNVFESFLDDALSGLDLKGDAVTATRFDALELLDRLVTSSGFRNIVQEEELIHQMPLNRRAAGELLDTLDHELRLIRRESQRGGRVVEIMHERLIPPVRRMLSVLRRLDTTRAALIAAHDMLYMLPDDPNPLLDSLPAHFREALLKYLDRLSLDALAAKTLLRSLLIAGNGDARSEAGDSSERWGKAILRLARALESTPGDTPGRAPFLTGGRLDAAISVLGRAGELVASDAARHAVLSAMADRTERAGDRIHNVLLSIPTVEHFS